MLVAGSRELERSMMHVADAVKFAPTDAPDDQLQEDPPPCDPQGDSNQKTKKKKRKGQAPGTVEPGKRGLRSIELAAEVLSSHNDEPPTRCISLFCDDSLAKDFQLFLIKSVRARKLMDNSHFSQALGSIVEMISCVDSGAVVLAKPESTRLHCISEVHASLAQYLHRVGQGEAACQHLACVARGAAQGARTWALFYKALLLLDSVQNQQSSDLERGVRELAGLSEACQAALQGTCVTPWLRVAMEYVSAVTMLRNFADDQEKIVEACRILEAALKTATESVSDLQLQTWVTIALADGLLMTEGHDSEAEEALVQQTMFVLSQVHVKCAQAGDQFLEVRILRCLERGYLRIAGSSKVAEASMKILGRRQAMLAKAASDALSSPLHVLAASWRPRIV